MDASMRAGILEPVWCCARRFCGLAFGFQSNNICFAVTVSDDAVYVGWEMAIDERTDQELVEACLDGNRVAFSELVSRHQDSVFGLAVGMTRNREDATDMAQEAFIRAYGKLKQYNPEYPFRAWILRICANNTKNLFRKRMRRRRAEEKHLKQVAVEQDGVVPDFHTLDAALAQLAPKLGVPLRLKHMEGMSYDEISEILGVGVSAAKMRVMRARKQLLEILKP
jgi:RNA polymerase sigma factor (sigma-70 family)